MFYSVGIFRTSRPGDSISNDPERTALRRRGKESGYTEVLQQGAGSLNFKRVLLTKGSQISRVEQFSTLLCVGKCKSLGSLKSSLSYVYQLSWAGSSVFLHPELPCRSPAGCQITSRVPLGLTSSHWWWWWWFSR